MLRGEGCEKDMVRCEGHSEGMLRGERHDDGRMSLTWPDETWLVDCRVRSLRLSRRL